MSDRSDGFGAFVVGLLLGGAAGAITALLLAPQTGEETRTMIREKAIELRDISSDTLEETINQAESTANDSVKQAEKVFNQAKAKASEATKKGQAFLEEQKEKISPKKTKEDKTE